MNDVHEFQVFTDYHQFYLMDAGVEPQIPEAVAEQDMLRRLRVEPHIVVFYTESDWQVPVKVAFVSEPFEAVGAWEQRSEFSLSLPSGIAVLCGCTDFVPECPRIMVAPSTYSGRAYFAGAAHGEERYYIILWPAAQPALPADGPASASLRQGRG